MELADWRLLSKNDCQNSKFTSYIYDLLIPYVDILPVVYQILSSEFSSIRQRGRKEGIIQLVLVPCFLVNLICVLLCSIIGSLMRDDKERRWYAMES